MLASEAASRSSVSRAYYAAYCHARNYASLHLEFIASGGSRDHGRLRAHFHNLKMQALADSLDMVSPQSGRSRPCAGRAEEKDGWEKAGGLGRSGLSGRVASRGRVDV